MPNAPVGLDQVLLPKLRPCIYQLFLQIEHRFQVLKLDNEFPTVKKAIILIKIEPQNSTNWGFAIVR